MLLVMSSVRGLVVVVVKEMIEVAVTKISVVGVMVIVAVAVAMMGLGSDDLLSVFPFLQWFVFYLPNLFGNFLVASGVSFIVG